MQTFFDADSRMWTVDISLAEIRDVKRQLGIDLLDVGNETLFARLVQDPELIVDVLHVVLGSQCDEKGVEAVTFARAMRGNTLDDASRALLESLVDFFPRRRREVLRAALRKTNRWLQTTADHARDVIESDRLDGLLQEQIAAMDREIDQRVNDLRNVSGKPSPSGGPSPAVTPSA
ncbi:MAG: hypothetical protein WBC44_03760 [Planctomycetaceae bacterium]